MKGESTSDASIYVDTRGLKDLARDLKRASPELAKQFRTKMKAAGEIVKAEAKVRSSFSTRIPGSLSVSVTGNGTTVKVVAKGSKAPDAAPIENRGKGFPRHPVFGNYDVWATTKKPAFLAPALTAKSEEITEAIAEVVDETFGEVGFR